MCRVLGVSRSGFYAWRTRPPSAAERRREGLTREVRRIHTEVRGRYGSPRMHAELVAGGHPCCVNFVAKLMRRAGVTAKVTRRLVRTTDSNHPLPVADNLLDRRFEVGEPNAVWLADITYVPTREGWVYLAAVEDLFSRRVVGWSMAATMTSRLVVDALGMAVSSRRPGEGVLAHSDRGSQYASEHYQRVLARDGIACSMSRKGDCWDNAPMESFFASLKTAPTATASRRGRCRVGYNSGDGVSVGLVGSGPFLPGVSHPHRRSRTMSDRPAPTPPRA
jgi:transposase InsO family protein